ncbi:cell wall-associated NlpC family hydrolase [Diaminobutyricimonas aerilata]|uniref:Cell wall-associated NlpC family hydrolase n=1 Tax=Diaminobutyricimonas aerilata TaxID=1162967 RepID=A0A2M9CN20_9MICO|nr:C40 family peptidase [Diaminobutyricimonas aerilata]PJJ73285.1 cell wall-associated NlpC family hydrolase [Diaminobutyricimonas aerilata]
MSVTEAIASIQQIESRLQQLFGPQGTTAAPPASTTPASAADFARVLGGQAPATGTPVAGSGQLTGDSIVAAAKKYLGVPYVFAGEDASGMDCSGLVQRVFADHGIDVPRLVRDQKNLGTEVPSLAEARPGDLIVTGGGGHISIYAGDGMVIHAPYPGRTVSLQKLWVGEDGIDTIRRIAPTQSAPPAPAPIAPAATDVTALLASALGGSGLGGSGLGGAGLSAGLGGAGLGGSAAGAGTIARLLVAQSALLAGARS